MTAGNFKKARKKIVSLLINDFKDSLSQNGSEATNDQHVEDPKEDNDGDEFYRLLRGAPPYKITRSSSTSAEYRLHWIRERTGPEAGMGYVLESTPSIPHEPIQTSFITSLMIKNKAIELGTTTYLSDYVEVWVIQTPRRRQRPMMWFQKYQFLDLK